MCISIVGCQNKVNNEDKGNGKNLEKDIVEDEKIDDEEKQILIQAFNKITDGKKIVLEDIIYIHKIDTSNGVYIYDSSDERDIKTDYAYEAKIQAVQNNENFYAYYYFYLDDKDEIQYNHETMLNPDKYYFVDSDNERLDYINVDKEWINENIMILY